MVVTIKRKEGESVAGFLYRANRRIQQSGILNVARNKRFFVGEPSRRSRRASAKHRVFMEQEIQRGLKQGLTFEEALDRARKIRKRIIKK